MKKITVALAGNPNSGKTTIFNMLTGARQHVGNYPGVTVEKVEGLCHYKGYDIKCIDLPGTYSLSAYSIEEIVARNYLIDHKPDVVIDVVDASNIERNLYLATQLIEMDVPLVLAFNMSDVARQKGLVFDIRHLSKLLEASIIETVGSKSAGKHQLLDHIIAVAESEKKPRTHRINFGTEIEAHLGLIEQLLKERQPKLCRRYNRRWLAIKLLEQDIDIAAKVTDEKVSDAVDDAIAKMGSVFAEKPDIIIADKRYGFISGACQETIKNTVELRHSISDMIDSVLTNKVLGLPIFLVLMLGVFLLTFKIGKYPMGWLEMLFNYCAIAIERYWPIGKALWLKSLITQGVIDGVCGVVIFLPNILLLFAAIALLEASGYMARAAFVMDRIMHKIGLHGKSFIPMLIGFGCSVPAIMATRILENRRNRFTTIMILPLMSCGARFTIYMLIIPAFFAAKWQGLMLWLIYIIGIVLAVLAAKILRLTLLKGETTPFVMELPPYRMPTLKSVMIHMWHQGSMYLKKAGTVILAISIVLWFAANYPKLNADKLRQLPATQVKQKQLQNSAIGRLGKFIEPALKPLGFDWKIGTALIGATAAKEVFVSQLGIVYAVEKQKGQSHDLRKILRQTYSPLTGFCILLFCLIATPCVATVAMTRQETSSWKWALLQFASLTVLAYIITLVVYQFGSLFL